LNSVMVFITNRGARRIFFQGGIGGGRGQWLGAPWRLRSTSLKRRSGGRAPGQEVRGAKPPEAESIFGHWMSNGAGKFSPCIRISTLGATLMIWEKFCRNTGGSRDPPCPFLGAPMQRSLMRVIILMTKSAGNSL